MFAKTLLAAALATVAVATPAFARTAEPVTVIDSAGALETTATRVAFTDLDLASPAGQAEMDARLRRAARKVCGSSFGAHPLSEEVNTRKCYAHALDTARQTLASAEYRKVMSR